MRDPCFAIPGSWHFRKTGIWESKFLTGARNAKPDKCAQVLGIQKQIFFYAKQNLERGNVKAKNLKIGTGRQSQEAWA